MEEKTRKINVTTMLEPEIFQRLTEISRQTDKSISALIREAVKEWLKNQ
jgi:predicted transcriptional regulator